MPVLVGCFISPIMGLIPVFRFKQRKTFIVYEFCLNLVDTRDEIRRILIIFFWEWRFFAGWRKWRCFFFWGIILWGAGSSDSSAICGGRWERPWFFWEIVLRGASSSSDSLALGGVGWNYLSFVGEIVIWGASSSDSSNKRSYQKVPQIYKEPNWNYL